MKKNLRVSFICLVLLFMMISLTEAHDSFQMDQQYGASDKGIALDGSLEQGPSILMKYKTFLLGRISGVEWKDHVQHDNPDLDVSVIVAIGRSKGENATLGIPFVTFSRTLSFEYVESFQGFYSNRWIFGTIHHYVRIGFP